jgi:PAS domain S-box-containing protein
MGKATIESLRRVIKVIKGVNLAVQSCQSEQELLEECCRIIVCGAGYRLSWIGMAQDNNKQSVEPIQQCGFEEGYLETLNLTWSNTERGKGPTGTAIRNNTPSICQDILNDPTYEPWRSEALKRGYASSIAIPLRSNNKVFGALNIYSAQADAFNKEESNLLENVADSLSHGIISMRLKGNTRKSEEKLRINEQWFRTIFEQAAVGVALIESETGRFLRINAYYCEMLGYTIEDLSGRKTFQEITHPDDLKTDLENMSMLLSGEIREFSMEKRYYHKDGSIVWVLLTVSPTWSIDEKPYTHIAVVQDITKRKNTDQELLESKHLAEMANRTKSEFLAVMSHEIRTPLNAILGMSEIALEFNNDHEMSRIINVIDRAGKNLLTLIEDILDISKIESGQLTIKNSPVDLHELTHEAIEIQNHAAKKKWLDLNCEIDPELPKQFEGDHKRLRQILLNLLGNAVKFTEKGQIELKVSYSNQQSLLFSVLDSGIGIPKEKQVLIFESFSQADSSNTRKHGGIGLR